MSNKKLFLIFFAILVGFLISMTFSLVFAGMQAGLNEDRAVSVPVNKEDIVRIFCEDKSRATGIHKSMQSWRMT